MGRTKTRLALPIVVATLCAVALGLPGCSNKSCTCPSDVEDELTYPARTSPENVIEKLNLAYERMDVDAYIDCLADSFRFYLNFAGRDPGEHLPESWNSSIEETIHQRMFAEDSGVDRITLVLTPSSMEWDGVDSLWVFEEHCDLRVTMGVLAYYANSPQRFVLEVDEETGRDGEELWAIVEWHDIDYPSDLGGQEGRVEDSSWTSIKCLWYEPPEEHVYPARTSPENVIEKLRLAYVNMDLDAYVDCLADSFRFYLFPWDVEPGEDPHWDQETERSIHENMFDCVEWITLTLTNATEDHDPGADPIDPMDDLWTREEETDLRVTEGIITYLGQHPQDFVLRVDPDETGPRGETLYEIIEWSDLGEEQQLREGSTWSSIKALYR